MFKSQNVRLGVALWLAGMIGVVVLSLTVIPQFHAKMPNSVPLGVAVAASIVQSGILLALAVWAGVGLSSQLGLGAPAIEALLAGSNALKTLSRQLTPAAFGGVLVGVLLVVLSHIAPAQIAGLGETVAIPMAPKLLYGGITEELLMRWGLMTVLIWIPWRFIQKRVGFPRMVYIVNAIVFAALLFGVLHLPAAAAMGASLTPDVIFYIIAGNTVPGVVFGILYWRYGIEAAMIAHALGHFVAILAAAL
jgi:Type II CAAX prenyl endopeptidase Rce1-like